MNKKRILFVAEAATLAHVARPLVLSAGLDASRFDLFMACELRSHWLLREFPGERLTLDSMGSAHFLTALAQGKPLFDEITLHRYVRADLALIDQIQPDVIVGDFRLSLSVSARLSGIPYVTISNCYWSPYWRPLRYPVPNLPLTRMLPLPIADMLFQVARPLAFALHCRPLNQVRRHYGLASLGSDLRRIYTDADQTLYADVPELFPGVQLPVHHHFIGPVLWSPPVSKPDWWDDLPDNRPVVYVTLGSSGQVNLLPQVLDALSALNVTVIASTAGGVVPDHLPVNARVAAYLPGEEAARRASLVICNGGSPTSQQALVSGVPVIGIASNLDQFLNMKTIQDAGAGAVIRTDRFNPQRLTGLAAAMLGETHFKESAKRLGKSFDRHDAQKQFATIINGLLI